MKGTLLAVLVALTAVTLSNAADSECLYRKSHGLSKHWPNPTDCGRFFRCTNRNVKREVICPADKEYNSKAGKCAPKGRGYCKLSLAQPLAGEDNVCDNQESGTFVPEDGYCRNFYICFENQAYPETCDVGSYFNELSSNCVPDTDSECWQNKCIDETNGAVIPDANSCQTYYTCNNNEATQRSCPDGTYLDPTSLTCKFGNCGDANVCVGVESGDFVPETGFCRNFYVCYNNLAYPESCDVGMYFSEVTENCVADPDSTCWQNLCITENDGAVIPDTNSCQTYYTCNNNEATQLSCPEGSYFDVTSLTCQTGNCGDSYVCAGVESGNFVPETGFCRNFYVCYNNLAYPESCDVGMYFSEVTENCVADPDSTCWQNLCITENDGAVIPDANSCQTYYTCNNYGATQQSCPEGSYFDVTSLTCQTGNCGDSYVCAGVESGNFVPETRFCRNFYVCYNNLAYPESCDVGMYFSEVTENCVADPDSTCWQNLCITENDGAVIPDTNSCQTYYTCNNNEATQLSCPEGSYFDVTSLTCQTGNCGDANVCVGVESGDFVPETGYCRNFYICYNNIAYPESCDAGSYFNEVTANCVPDTVSTCWQNKCIGEADGAVLPDAESCTSYYTCENNEATQQSCSEGSYFDTTALSCQPGTCTDTPTETTTPCTETTTPCTETTTACTEQPVETTMSSTCPGGYIEGDFVPNPNNCMLFYICSAGELVESSCGTGNYFDADTESCQFDANGVCPACQTAVSSQRSLQALAVVAEDGHTSHELQARSMKGAKLDTCFGIYYEGQFLAHPNDCHKFLICASGALSVHECGRDNFYNADTHACERDTNNRCALSKVNAAQQGLETNCFDVYYEGQLVAHPASCRRFLICSAGHLSTQSCGAGQYFNATLGACTLDPWNACPLRTIEHMQLPTQQQLAKPALDADCGVTCDGGYADGQAVSNDAECSKYYICLNGTLVDYACETCYRFDAATSVCVLDATHTCWPVDTECGQGGNETSICTGQPDETKLADPNDCGAFYLCFDGEAIAEPCYTGEWFNATLGACEPDVYAVCVNPCADITGPLALANPECDKFYYCSNGQTTVETCDVGGFDAVTGTCQESAVCATTMCKDKADGYTFPVPNDSSKFYYCLDGEAILDDCPDEKGYDEQEMACVPQPSSDCDQSVCAGSSVGEAFPTISGSNASAFCICTDGAAYKRYCEPDYVFVEELGICYSNAPCDPEICSDFPEYTVTPNRNDTQSFCLCVSQTPVIVDCPNNGTFNSILLLCMTTAEQASNCSSTYCRSQSDYTVFPALTGDSGFCYCSSNVGVYRPCDTGAVFDSAYDVCVPTETNCDATYCANQADYTIYPAVSGTSGFCYCLANSGVYKACDAGTSYDPDMEICMPVAAQCDITACANAVDGLTYSIPAIGNEQAFCFCMSPTNMLTLSCASDKIYSQTLGICVSSTLTAKLKWTTTPTDVASNSAALKQCPGGFKHGQFIPYQQDCQQFYICAFGKLQQSDCGTSNYFDKQQSLCVWDRAGVCAANKNASCRGGYHEGDFVAIATNKRLYYVCYNGQLQVQDCGLGNNFDAQRGICMPLWAQAVGNRRFWQRSAPAAEQLRCINSEKRAVSTNCAQYELCWRGKWQKQSCRNQRYYDVEQRTCLEPRDDLVYEHARVLGLPKCGNETETKLLPSKNGNCQQYYRCEQGKWLLLSCAEGQHYSRQLSTCIKTANGANCLLANETKKNLTTAETNIMEVKTIDVKGNEKEMSLPNVGSHETKTTKLPQSFEERNTTILEAIIVQRNETKLEQQSKENNQTQLIVGSTQLNATQMPLTNEKWNGTENETQHDENLTQTSFDKRNETQLLTQVSQAPFAAEFEPESESPTTCRHTAQRYYAANCAMYQMCLEGQWWYQYCPLGMYFNRSRNYCLPLDEAMQCADAFNTPAAGAEVEQFETQACHVEGELRAPAAACDKYYVCAASKWHAQYCPTAHYYNGTAEACLPFAEQLANDAAQQQAVCAQLRRTCVERQLRVFPLNCTAYEQCVAGQWQHASCARDWSYDELLQQCVPNDGSCASNGLRRVCRAGETRTHPLAQHCTQFYYCERGSWTLGECLPGHYFNAASGSCMPQAPHGQCRGAQQEALPGNASAISNPCAEREDGATLAHATDCRRFYLCLHGDIISTQRCANGSYFDAATGYCHPDVDGACRPTVSTDSCAQAVEGARLPQPENCRAYYECTALLGAQLRHCAAGFYYVAAAQQCQPDGGLNCAQLAAKDAPADVCATAAHGTRLPHPQHCNLYYACVHGLAIVAECVAPQQFNITLSACQHANSSSMVCASGQLAHAHVAAPNCSRLPDGFYLPDLSDCTQFYICAGGQALPQQCADGAYYDSQQHLCLPDDGACPYVTHAQPAAEVTPPPHTICEDRHGMLLPDAANCNNFYVCLNGKLRQECCYAEHYFNASLGQCQAYAASPPALDARRNDTLQARARQCAAERSSFVELCKLLPENGGSMAEQDDCRRYISCQQGVPTSQRCRNGENYDSLLGFCRQNDGTCQLENGQRNGVCSGRHGQLTHNPDNCRGYFVCLNEQTIERYCEAHEYFDAKRLSCRPDLLQQCAATKVPADTLAKLSCKGLSESILYPNTHDNCHSYFDCVKGEPKLQNCKDQLYFDATSKRCVKEISKCVMPTANSRLLTDVNVVKRQLLPSYTKETEPSLFRLSNEKRNKLCEDAETNKFQANVLDECRSYYKCAADESVSYTTCPTGMLFSNEAGDCIEAERVICGN